MDQETDAANPTHFHPEEKAAQGLRCKVHGRAGSHNQFSQQVMRHNNGNNLRVGITKKPQIKDPGFWFSWKDDSDDKYPPLFYQWPKYH